MKPIKPLVKHFRWECAPYAFAMALGVTVHELYARIGHDGSQVIWPDMREPLCRRGFHHQELIHTFREIGTFSPVERFPRLGHPAIEGASTRLHPAMDWEAVMMVCRGVLEGITPRGTRHAVAFERGKVFDPDNGLVSKYNELKMEPQLAWVLHPKD